MKNVVLLIAGLALAGLARAGLEIPGPGSVQSGIGLVMGWDCTASRIDVVVGSGPPLPAAMRMPRGDTAVVCGRTDTGFALLFNYNTLAVGQQFIQVLADGRPIAAHTFRVAHAGVEYMTGKSARLDVRHFPNPGDTTTVIWDEEKQNFSIESVAHAVIPLPRGAYYSGVYYGAAFDMVTNAFRCGPVPIPNPRAAFPGTFEVQMDDNGVTLGARLADGRSCSASGGFTQGSAKPGSVFAIVRSACREFDDLLVVLDGEILGASARDSCAYAIRAIR